MEDVDGIGLQPLNHNKEDNINGSQLSTARSTSVGRGGNDGVSTKGTNLGINLSTSNTSTTVPSNDSVITIDRPNNTVSNFLSEIETKSSGGSSNINWDEILKNLSYILAWYFFSTALSFYNKNLMGKENFNLNLPLLISAMHTGMHVLITTILMNGYCSFIYKKPEGKSVSVRSYFTRVVS
jgi:hypothetical protein